MASNVSTNMNMTTPEVVLKPNNYLDWSITLKAYLEAQGVWDVVDESEPSNQPEENQDHQDNDHEIVVNNSNGHDWRKKNAMALYAIRISCSEESLSLIRDITSPKIAWDTLAESYNNRPTQYSEADDDKTHLQMSAFTQQAPLTPNIESSTITEVDLQAFFDSTEHGNLKVVQNFIKLKPEIVRRKKSYLGETALHLAAKIGHVDIVEELVSNMREEDLEIQDQDGWTALASATMNGITKIAECMIQKNKKIVIMKTLIQNCWFLPIELALDYNHKHLSCYLFSVTPFDLLLPEKGRHGAMVVTRSISVHCYDIALHVLERCPQVAITSNNWGQFPILVVTENIDPSSFRSGCELRFWQQWIYDCIPIQKNDSANSDTRIDVKNAEDNQSKISDTNLSGW
ncbi:uncharacterized protein LOC133789205 [Humulus lupulus]|uniref:uncharacterized protein LOC133789205 n=1 Tax=Humulus lupulus TaxID=3486 RepID=UPI002B405456|nr:uncharacterized protein LOC133789205 [Humulus lupulus]